MAEAARRMRRRGLVGTLLVVVLAWIGPVLGGCMNISTPIDHLLNLGDLPRDEGLEAPDGPRLVVLQHGLARSSASLARLARALRRHGYQVLNTSWASWGGTVQEASARLARAIEGHPLVRAGEPLEVAFVGHSMGGLVIRHYLARPDALRPWACVFLGTPQRGAAVVEEIGGSWSFRLALGTAAALQLLPSDPLYGELADPVAIEGCAVGVVLGITGRPEGRSPRVPGDDDGRVGEQEARLPGAEHLALRVGHTALTTRDDVLRATLGFLRRGTFAE